MRMVGFLFGDYVAIWNPPICFPSVKKQLIVEEEAEKGLKLLS